MKKRAATPPKTAEVIPFKSLKLRSTTFFVGQVVTLHWAPGLWRIVELNVNGSTCARVVNAKTGAEYDGLIHPGCFSHPKSSQLESAPAKRVTDINEWRRTRLARASGDEEHSGGLPLGLVEVDSAGKITAFNPSERLSAKETHRQLGRNLFKCAQLKGYEQRFRAFMQSGAAEDEFSFTCILDRRAVHVRVILTRVCESCVLIIEKEQIA